MRFCSNPRLPSAVPWISKRSESIHFGAPDIMRTCAGVRAYAAPIRSRRDWLTPVRMPGFLRSRVQENATLVQISPPVLFGLIEAASNVNLAAGGAADPWAGGACVAAAG